MALFSVPLIILLCWLLERAALLVGNLFKVWRVSANKDKLEEEGDFYEIIKYYVEREIEESTSASREELLSKAIGRAILDKYISESNDRRRKAEIIKFLKKLEEAMKIGQNSVDNMNLADLPLPKIKKPTVYLKLRKPKDLKHAIKKPEGNWPVFFTYPWDLVKESAQLNTHKKG